ncbi:MAG TPA: hypothetical protein VIJ19_09100 [Opitutaceae bacterium]
MRLFLAVILLSLVAGCKSTPTEDQLGRVMVVDRHGNPLQNAVLTPDPENPPVVPRVFDDEEIKERASDAKGVFHVDMDDCIWGSDGCYHFRIHRAGFEDSTMTVSKDLFPPMLKVEMREKGWDTPPSSPH